MKQLAPTGLFLPDERVVNDRATIDYLVNAGARHKLVEIALSLTFMAGIKASGRMKCDLRSPTARSSRCASST